MPTVECFGGLGLTISLCRIMEAGAGRKETEEPPHAVGIIGKAPSQVLNTKKAAVMDMVDVSHDASTCPLFLPHATHPDGV